jgi:hypothetical protein
VDKTRKSGVAAIARRSLLAVGLLVAPTLAGDPTPCASVCGDITGDGAIDLADHAAFVACLGEEPGSSQTCTCSDFDGSGAVDLADFVLLQPVFGQWSNELPPNCTGAVGSNADANLTAYRPQHGGGYAPFLRTAVSEADEEHPDLGPGIRIHDLGDVDPAGEDDLIELVVSVDPPGAAVTLRREHAALRVWTTRDRSPGSELSFAEDESQTLPIEPGQTTLTLWAEWADPSPGLCTLEVGPAGATAVRDAVVFHTFSSIAMALGGEGQVPSDPPDANSGTFVVAVDLYRAGYDVHMYDEDNVSSSGTGAVHDEVVTAVQHRGVAQIAIFGYSHGGGSTHDLAQRLESNRATIGFFDIVFTSYVDAVRNSSDVDVNQELRRPPGTLYHLNHYQVGSFFQDLGLDGGPVTNSHPAPTGLNVETTPWGAGSTHFEVDDYIEVRSRIIADLTALTDR